MNYSQLTNKDIHTLALTTLVKEFGSIDFPSTVSGEKLYEPVMAKPEELDFVLHIQTDIGPNGKVELIRYHIQRVEFITLDFIVKVEYNKTTFFYNDKTSATKKTESILTEDQRDRFVCFQDIFN